MAFERLRDFRLKVGLTQSEFAKYMGHSRQDSYSKLENGTYNPQNAHHMHLNTLEFIYHTGRWDEYVKYINTRLYR